MISVASLRATKRAELNDVLQEHSRLKGQLSEVNARRNSIENQLAFLNEIEALQEAEAAKVPKFVRWLRRLLNGAKGGV